MGDNLEETADMAAQRFASRCLKLTAERDALAARLRELESGACETAIRQINQECGLDSVIAPGQAISDVRDLKRQRDEAETRLRDAEAENVELKAMKLAFEQTPKQWSTAQAPTMEAVLHTAAAAHREQALRGLLEKYLAEVRSQNVTIRLCGETQGTRFPRPDLEQELTAALSPQPGEKENA